MIIRILHGLSDATTDAQLTVVPYGVVDEIDYRKELKGETKELVSLGRVNRKTGGHCLVCAPSDNHGLKRLSAFLFEGGKLISIFDLNDGNVKYSPSYGVGTFSAGGVKCGVLVGDDGYDPDLVKALSLCGTGVIINLYPDLLTEMHVISARFFSYVYGVDFIGVGKNSSVACRAGGIIQSGVTACDKAEIAVAGESFDMPCKRLYRESRTKKTGNR